MSILETTARFISQRGESMTLAREGEGTTISLKGKRIPGTTEAIGNTAEQQRFRVKIGKVELLASAWATKIPSAATDTITVGGLVRAVMDVRPLNDGGVTVLYDLEVAG